MPSKIPFGYEIIGGKAYVNAQEAAQLKTYFRKYLEGLSMSAAAQEARLPFSSTTYPHLFKRKEYLGTDYYPALITEEYQRQLIDEWERRKEEAPRWSKKQPKKGVKIYTDFRLVRARSFEPEDPVDCAAALYQRIRPKYKSDQAPTRE